MDADLAYRASSTDQSNGPRIVVLLYEQLVKDLRRALAAIEHRDVEARTFEINHALAVVGQLQAFLDMDLGGEVAANLDRFYNLVQRALWAAQVNGSTEILQQQIANILSVREAWVEVEKMRNTPLPAPARPGDDSESASAWKA